MNVIECKNVTKTYGRVKALNNLSFSIKENTITGVIGRNGAGKTTLLKTIAGYFLTTEGDVQVFSEPPFNNINVSSNMIFIDDNMIFPPGLTLGELLQSSAIFYPNWNLDLAMRLLDYFDLGPKQFHHHLSKGMKSTFNMILGLAARCPLTIFDEPTTGMDAAVRKDFYKALLKDYVEHPRTILLSSHLLNEIESILEDVLLIRNGQLALHQSVMDLKEYAIGLRGKSNVIQEMTEGLDVIYEETFGIDNIYTVLINNSSTVDLEKARQSGIELLPVATEDLCVYLTSKNKGGIQDVFNRN